LQFSVQLENSDTQEHDVTIWLRKNGVDFPGSAGFVAVVAKHGGVNGHALPSWNYLLDVVGGDYYELVWSATSTQVTMPFIPAGTPPPSTASAIFTVTQQAGILAGTGITAINSLTGAVQTMGVGTTGTDFAISSSGTAHTFNLPTASASNRGALSSGDWTTFSNKQATITGAATTITTSDLTVNKALISNASGKVAVSSSVVGYSLATLTDPNAIRYVRINADNTVTAITAATLKSELLATTPYGVVAYGSGFLASVLASSTTYGTITSGVIAFNANIANREFTIPFGGTVKNLYVHTSLAQGAGGSLVITLMQNQIATSLVVTVPASGVAGTRSNLTDSFTAVAGDKLVFRLVNNHTNVSATIVSVSFIIEQL
jgi:hypothetical protein